MTITPRTAARVSGMLKYHAGDISAALHDGRITLQSLGSYTDRRTQSAVDLLSWLNTRSAERLPIILEQLETIANTFTENA